MPVMSLTRAALLARQRPAATFLSHRKSSSSTHSHHEEHNGEDYQRKEGLCRNLRSTLRLIGLLGFGGALWRNTFLLSLVTVAAYKYAPEPAEDVYLTRWIALYTSPRNLWLELNAKHTAMEQTNSEATMLFTDAKKPKVHRYRHPQ